MKWPSTISRLFNGRNANPAAKFWWKRSAAGVLVTLFVVLLLRSRHSPAEVSAAIAPVPSVAVVKVNRQDLYQEVTIPAEFRPYSEVELHAKVSGYVQEIKVDFGDTVKAGQLLATLEIPELNNDLQRANAAQQHAEADYKNAHLSYTRLINVNQTHPNLVAQQDLDACEAKDLDAAATIAGAKADVQKFQTMVDYSRIVAPFAGVITRRYVDPGALIQAGTSSDPQAKSLVRVSDSYRLRLDFPVSVTYVKQVRVGDSLEVRVQSLGGQTFNGIISRFTHQVDEATRTMMVEIEVPNPKLELLPGMYATVVLKVERRPQALAIPIQALAGDKKRTVYVVNLDHTMEERFVTLGLETPDQYEVLSGLNEGEWVMIGSRARVHPGQKVEPKITETLAAQ